MQIGHAISLPLSMHLCNDDPDGAIMRINRGLPISKGYKRNSQRNDSQTAIIIRSFCKRLWSNICMRDFIAASKQCEIANGLIVFLGR